MWLKSLPLLGYGLVYSMLLVIASEIVEMENYDDEDDTININEFNTSEMDQCVDLCTESYFLLPSHQGAQKTCQRGCRFFNIISLRSHHQLNISVDECYQSCDDAYDDYDYIASCHVGCRSTLKKKQSEMEAVIEIAANVFIMEPDMEIEVIAESPDSLQSSQRLENMLNLAEYRIPETKIRTMPIEEAFLLSESADTVIQDSSGGWLDCAAKNSGIPKVVLIMTILGAVLVTIWLSLSSERKAIVNDIEKHSEINEQQVDECPTKCDTELLQLV